MELDICKAEVREMFKELNKIESNQINNKIQYKTNQRKGQDRIGQVMIKMLNPNRKNKKQTKQYNGVVRKNVNKEKKSKKKQNELQKKKNKMQDKNEKQETNQNKIQLECTMLRNKKAKMNNYPTTTNRKRQKKENRIEQIRRRKGGNNSFACRGWADDLILLSKSKKNMQKLIDEAIRVFN